MSQHVPETCNESSGLWLPLIEYSVRSGVSLSTIRRKIKNNSIPYRLEKGRYLILFVHHDGMTDLKSQQTVIAPTSPVRWQAAEIARPKSQSAAGKSVVENAEGEGSSLPLAENAVRMVSEAFEHALKEKDERIRLLEKSHKALEERLTELRFLVRMLEEKYAVRY